MTDGASRVRPLDGLGVAVTRPETAAGPLSRRLEWVGARVLSWQAVEIAPPDDGEPLARAVESLRSYDWIVLTSVNAVGAVVAAMRFGEQDDCALAARPLDAPRVLAGGRATAEAAKRAGFRVHRIADVFGAAGLIECLQRSDDLAGARVLLPLSALAGPQLAADLAQLGAAVEQVVAYATRPTALDAARCRAQLAAREVAAITFTSPSAIASLARAFGEENLAFALRGVRIVSIGPTTSRTLGDHGLTPTAQAAPSTLDGVVAATIAALE